MGQIGLPGGGWKESERERERERFRQFACSARQPVEERWPRAPVVRLHSFSFGFIFWVWTTMFIVRWDLVIRGRDSVPLLVW